MSAVCKKHVTFSEDIQVHTYSYYENETSFVAKSDNAGSVCTKLEHTLDAKCENDMDKTEKSELNNMNSGPGDDSSNKPIPFCGTFHCSQIRFMQCSICNTTPK